jgi:hypothetical protein
MSKRKFQNGDVVILKYSMSQFPAGTKGVIEGYCYDSEYNVGLVTQNGYQGTFMIKSYDLDLFIGNKQTTIEVFNEQIDKALSKIEAIKAFIEETKAKIDFMIETDSDTFNENEFKAYHTLTIIEQSGMSKMDKAKAIAALISGK